MAVVHPGPWGCQRHNRPIRKSQGLHLSKLSGQKAGDLLRRQLLAVQQSQGHDRLRSGWPYEREQSPATGRDDLFCRQRERLVASDLHCHERYRLDRSE